jgi:hypothetical protein
LSFVSVEEPDRLLPLHEESREAFTATEPLDRSHVSAMREMKRWPTGRESMEKRKKMENVRKLDLVFNGASEFEF